MPMARALAFVVVLLAASAGASTATTLTLHNICPHPIWPLVTPNSGLPSISDNTARLDPNALLSLSFPPTFWAGRVVARTGCDSAASRCDTGAAPPVTVAQLTVHDGGDLDLAAYSVSLVDGFNVPMVISPQAIGGGQCPALGCAVDLNCDCPPAQRVADGAACRGPPGYFKNRCPLTRTTPTDVEPVPQSCRAPGELKIIFCQPSMVATAAAEAEMVIRTVVADS
ncbi:osmotin-like protein [Phragmites australis]|uniref:osmotin-like protein n=1 Tax=Phragmites australis TaxID=29695 RepID=UPI002D77066B|nr:osmotin-like protein [Phragmites australis]